MEQIQVGLTPVELSLVMEALARAAKRQESEARFDPRNAKGHEEKAERMRKLALKLSMV